jgi:hypothetical protein
MGTTGAFGMVENMLGSNTSALVGETKTPIIAVPKDAEVNFPKHIIVANDLMDSGEEEIFDVLKEIATETYSSIDFLFIGDKEEDAYSKIERLKLADFDSKFDTEYHPFHFKENENVEDGILEYIENKDFDLLVVIAHQRGFWEGLSHKSISKSLVKHAIIPTLVLPG